LPAVNITSTVPGLFTPGLVTGLFILLLTVIPFGLSFFWHHPLLLRMRQLISLPLLFFKTNGSIIVADPRIITTPRIFKSRIAAYTDAVVHADRPSVLTLVHSNDPYPLLLKRLDTEQVTYHVMRFPSEPGVDLLVITPLSQPISPFE